MSITLLAMSDIHGKEGAVGALCKWVRRRGHYFDAVVIAGDIGNPQKVGSVCKILRMLRELRKPIYYVRGNWDVRDDSCSEGIDLEKKGFVDLGPVALIGHGRRVTPIKNIPRKTIVLVTHYPPFSIMDRSLKVDSSHGMKRAGLLEINYLIDTYKPKVHIFGHSHSLGGIDLELNKVRYINVARIDRVTREGEYIGNYAIITINNQGNVKVDWFFLNGTLKKCDICGRKLVLPKKWNICRKCANKDELKFEKVDEIFSLVRVSIKNYNTTGAELILHNTMKIPIFTIKNRDCLRDFLDILVRKIVAKELKKSNDKLLFLSKDKVIEFYKIMHDDGLVTPFSEYLFSCKEDVAGKRLCSLMRLFSLEKRTYVIWGLKKLNNTHIIKSEYVLFDEKIAIKRKDILSSLIKNGFNPITYKLTPMGG